METPSSLSGKKAHNPHGKPGGYLEREKTLHVARPITRIVPASRNLRMLVFRVGRFSAGLRIQFSAALRALGWRPILHSQVPPTAFGASVLRVLHR